MNTLKIIWASLADANGRLWGRSKILWLGAVGGMVCVCCLGVAGILPRPPQAVINATATARAVQEGAHAIETDNAIVIRTMTAQANPVPSKLPTIDIDATATLFANQVLQTQTAEASIPTDIPISDTPHAALATDTPFFFVITNTPARVVATQALTRPTNMPTAPLPTSFADACPNGCTTPVAGCLIIGNANASGGDKIYHLPGMQNYNDIKFRPAEGDRYFCTEASARANGFRRAQR